MLARTKPWIRDIRLDRFNGGCIQKAPINMPTPPHQAQTVYLSPRSAAVRMCKIQRGAESYRPSVKRENNAANLLRYLLVPPPSLRSQQSLIKPFDCKTREYDIDHGLRPVREVSYLKSLLCHRSLSQTRYQILNERCSSGGNTPVVFQRSYCKWFASQTPTERWRQECYRF